MKTADAWFSEYSESHRHPINKKIHYACVPAIMWSVLALLWALKLPLGLNAALVVGGLGLAYYLTLSVTLGLGMAVVTAAMLLLCRLTEAAAPLVPIAIGVFAVAWVGQFIGHKIEGKKPSFYKDVQFLLIGPLWILAKVVGTHS